MMSLSFANPAGCWALLALPVVLAIHFLQRESRRVLTSTLFLFDAVGPVSARGRRLERLRNSLPLWLQITAVLLLTWLLTGPRWLRRDSGQRVVVVLDSSVSMRAFREEMRRALSDHLRALTRVAARTDWRLIETDPTRPTLYAGNDLGALLTAADNWTPRLGTHDFQPALNAALSLTHDGGIAVFVTDRRADVPEGVKLLAVGRPIDNCGWIGLTVDGDTWRALVKNDSAAPQTRAWHLETDGHAAGPDETLSLAPGQTRTLGGVFPPGRDRCELVLSADAFTMDDRLPIVRPQPKRLTLAVETGTALEPFLRRLAGSVPQADTVGGQADVRLAAWSATAAVAGPGILFAAQEKEAAEYLAGEVVAENGSLMAGLSWAGLVCRETEPIPARTGDDVLLWQGAHPLIFLRGDALLINFDVRQSNADRLPAFVVLLNRFLESVRARKIAFERRNVETNQLLETTRAPDTPGFFDVKQDGHVRFEGAAHFADAREADFRDAASVDTLSGEVPRLLARNRQQDFLWLVFALLLGAVMLANWSAAE